MIDPKSGMTIEEVSNGFLGRPVIYYLWKDNHMIAHSFDKVNWRIGTWFEKALTAEVKPVK